MLKRKVFQLAVGEATKSPAHGKARGTAAPKPPLPPSACHSDPVEEAMLSASAAVPKLLTPEEVAAALGVTDRSLERWRITGDGPRFVKLTRSTVRYSADDVAAFIADRTKANTAQ